MWRSALGGWRFEPSEEYHQHLLERYMFKSKRQKQGYDQRNRSSPRKRANGFAKRPAEKRPAAADDSDDAAAAAQSPAA